MSSHRFKRHYSRGGCRECKRRKIKCDEAKPSCSECTRLDKDCSYPQVGEKVIRGSSKEAGGSKIRHGKRAWNFQMYMGPENPKKRMRWEKVSTMTDTAEASTDNKNNPDEVHSGTVQSNNLNGIDLSTRTNASAVPQSRDDVSPSSLWSGDVYSSDDLNLLAADLNNLVNDIMFNSNIVPSTDNQEEFPDLDSGTTSSLDNIPNGLPYDIMLGKTDDERRYLSQFYERFSSQKLPFGVDNDDPGSYRNAIREVVMQHAAKEPFLLAAVLSQGAYSASEFEANERQRQHDLENCGNYLTNCLKLLVPALNRTHEKQVKGDMTSNIENILLTVLSLAMSNACNEKQSWRPHLKGAKEIIMKATSSKIRSSPTLILCKMWFADFEVLAGLSSGMGGTLGSKDEMDLVFNFEDQYEQSVLRNFGLVQDNGFCVVTGYHIVCLGYFRDLCDLLRRKRSEPEKIPDPFEYMDLISGLYAQYQVKFARLESTSKGPVLRGSLCDTVQKSDGTFKTVSWMDLSQQAFTLAGLVTTFTRLLHNPPESPHLKGLVTKMVDLIKVFQDCKSQDSTRFPFTFSMIQWPISVAGFACTEPSQYSVIENFFEMCSRTGSNSANLTLNRIKKVWELREAGEVVDSINGEGNVDIISY
ncbi:hypothetical protein CANMA_003000 [Candida margitis]|uniref:uncharacterized protein n=1 Tax=Candida margitis TaxID=1775924 RepID=UPI00222607F5|nr:uncharacterized protein CANMA_003000 [Candida margitis]KAI5967566.1 hypothetical protein CANMA_003000 [Candida margitis]